MSFGWTPRKKPPMALRMPPPGFDQAKFQKRAQELIGHDAVLPYWTDKVRCLSADQAAAAISKILAQDSDVIDGVITDGKLDNSIRRQPVDAAEKMVRIAIVLACLKYPLSGKMFDAHSDGVLFEAYNRITLSYLHDVHPAAEWL